MASNIDKGKLIVVLALKFNSCGLPDIGSESQNFS